MAVWSLERVETIAMDGSGGRSIAALSRYVFFFFQAEDGIRDYKVTGVQTCALPIFYAASAYPVGVLSDRMDRVRLLGLGLAVLIAADVVLALSASVGVTLLGVAL